MKKISYLLASAVSALAALMAGAATAATTNPERADQNTTRASAGSGETRAVSQNARHQILAQATPSAEPKTAKPGRVPAPKAAKPGVKNPGGPKSGATVTWHEKDPNWKENKGASRPGGNVQQKFQSNKPVQQKIGQ